MTGSGWLSSLGIAVLTAVLGLVSAGVIAVACVGWYRISGFEGASGYFVVVTALLGGAAAGVLGLVTAGLVAGSAHPGLLRALGLSLGLTLSGAGLAALVAWRLADIPPTLGGRELDLEVEFRLPAGEPLPAGDSRGVLTLGSVINHRQRKATTGELDLSGARQDAGRWVVPGSVFLFTARGLRSVSAEVGGRPIGGVLVPLPAHPRESSEQWSDWGPRPPAGSPPWPDSRPSYRFRVVRRAEAR